MEENPREELNECPETSSPKYCTIAYHLKMFSVVLQKPVAERVNYHDPHDMMRCDDTEKAKVKVGMYEQKGPWAI